MKVLNPTAVFVDILSPDVPEKLSQELYFLSESNLRTLGAMLSQMNMFVCGDTGPMHLASASQVPTVALFKATAPELYGTLGKKDLSLSIGSHSPQEIAIMVSSHYRELS